MPVTLRCNDQFHSIPRQMADPNTQAKAEVVKQSPDWRTYEQWTNVLVRTKDEGLGAVGPNERPLLQIRVGDKEAVVDAYEQPTFTLRENGFSGDLKTEFLGRQSDGYDLHMVSIRAMKDYYQGYPNLEITGVGLSSPEQLAQAPGVPELLVPTEYRNNS